MSVTSALHGIKSVIVTGANGGLGYESNLHLSRLSVGKLIMGVRTLAKGENAKKRVLGVTGQPYDSVKAFLTRAATGLQRLDGVLANASVMGNVETFP
ncbi:hypothetical protein PG999_002107 [Apiospora kogelbergensis]|uniref:Short chain dehydrogenase n=1 Tax=Apiospora kogelbergensis TaxID=1337665 RepID=A0AAW0R773_9PEZI